MRRREFTDLWQCRRYLRSLFSMSGSGRDEWIGEGTDIDARGGRYSPDRNGWCW